MAQETAQESAPELRRFGIIGDVHAQAVALRLALDHLRHQNVARVLCVGDVVDGHGDVNACCALLCAPEVTCVRGNHERWWLAGSMRDLPDATTAGEVSAASSEFLRALPATKRFASALGPLLLCHGIGDDDMARLLPYDDGYALANNDAVQRVLALEVAVHVSGHSHVRMVRTVGGTVFINAGTLHPAFDPCFGLVDLDERTVRFFDLVGSGGVREGETFRFGLAGDDLWGAM